MLLQLEIMFPDKEYDIKDLKPKLESITLSFKKEFYDDIIILNIDPHKVDYRIYKNDKHIFIEAITNVYKNSFGVEYNYFGDLDIAFGYLGIVDIDIEMENALGLSFYDINPSISRMSLEYTSLPNPVLDAYNEELRKISLDSRYIVQGGIIE